MPRPSALKNGNGGGNRCSLRKPTSRTTAAPGEIGRHGDTAEHLPEPPRPSYELTNRRNPRAAGRARSRPRGKRSSPAAPVAAKTLAPEARAARASAWQPTSGHPRRPLDPAHSPIRQGENPRGRQHRRAGQSPAFPRCPPGQPRAGRPTHRKRVRASRWCRARPQPTRAAVRGPYPSSAAPKPTSSNWTQRETSRSGVTRACSSARSPPARCT